MNQILMIQFQLESFFCTQFLSVGRAADHLICSACEAETLAAAGRQNAGKDKVGFPLDGRGAVQSVDAGIKRCAKDHRLRTPYIGENSSFFCHLRGWSARACPSLWLDADRLISGFWF